jgi:PAS domain S-box-containing protein
MNIFKNEEQNPTAVGSSSQAWRQIGGLVLVAFAYWITVRLGLLVVAQPEDVASIWPASGVALAVLLLNPKKKWPILLAVIFVTNALGNLSESKSWTVSLGFALANILEAYLAAWLVTYLYRSKITFQSSRQMFSLFAAAIFGNGLTALLGAAIPALTSGAPFFKTWLVWWSADGLGMILIAPLIVTLAASPGIFKPQKPLHAIEGILLFLVLAVFTWLIFGPYTVAEEPVLRNYMLFPVLIWLAFRFSPRGMAIDLTLVATIAIWNLLLGNGILAFEDQNITHQLVNLQFFLSVLAFSGFLMSAIITERKRGEEQLEQNENIFRSFLEYSPVYVFFKDKSTRTLRLSSNYETMLGIPVSEALGKTMFELFPSELAKKMVADDLKILEDGKPVDVIEELNGHTYETTKFPIFTDGKPDMLAGFTMDITERLQAEQALHSAEAFNKTIIAHSPVGISVRSCAGSLLSANAAWKNIWAIPEEDYQKYLLHKSEKLQFDERDNYLKTKHPEIRRVYEQGGSLFLPDMKITNPRPGGAEWVSQHFYAILDEKSQVDRVVILTEDISTRKKVEEEITRNRVLLERVQDVAQLGSWELNLTNRTVVASAEAHRIYGKENGVLTLSEVQNAVMPEYRPIMDAALTALIENGQEYDIQFKIRRSSDSAIREVHSRAEYNTVENTVVGSIQDVTERNLILQVVMESEEKFRTLFEHAHDAIHIDNEKDEILDANVRACELFGYNREELLGMKVADLQAAEVRGQVGKTLQGEIDQYGNKVFEGLNQCKDGTKVPVEISVSKISTSQGIRFISIVRDISERKRIELELREQIDTLERFQDVTVGRELKMIELKKEINALLVKAGEQEKYRIIDV